MWKLTEFTKIYGRSDVAATGVCVVILKINTNKIYEVTSANINYSLRL